MSEADLGNTGVLTRSLSRSSSAEDLVKAVDKEAEEGEVLGRQTALILQSSPRAVEDLEKMQTRSRSPSPTLKRKGSSGSLTLPESPPTTNQPISQPGFLASSSSESSATLEEAEEQVGVFINEVKNAARDNSEAIASIEENARKHAGCCKALRKGLGHVLSFLTMGKTSPGATRVRENLIQTLNALHVGLHTANTIMRAYTLHTPHLLQTQIFTDMNYAMASSGGTLSFLNSARALRAIKPCVKACKKGSRSLDEESGLIQAPEKDADPGYLQAIQLVSNFMSVSRTSLDVASGILAATSSSMQSAHGVAAVGAGFGAVNSIVRLSHQLLRERHSPSPDNKWRIVAADTVSLFAQQTGSFAINVAGYYASQEIESSLTLGSWIPLVLYLVWAFLVFYRMLRG